MTTRNSSIHSSTGVLLHNAFWCQVTAFLIVVTVFTFAPSLFAATKEERNAEGKQFADTINSGISDDAKNTDTSIIPQYQGEDVPAKDYYSSGIGIEDEAQVNAATDENAIYITSSRDTRPNVNIDPATDPLFERDAEIVSLSRSLTDTYSGCVQLPFGDAEISIFDDEYCRISGVYYNEYPECNQMYEASCTNGATYRDPYSKSVNVNLGSKGRNYFTAEVNFLTGEWNPISPSDGNTKVAIFDLVSNQEACVENTLTIVYNGVSPWSGAPSRVGGGPLDTTVIFRELQRPSCENGFIGRYQIEDRTKGSDPEWVLGGTFSYTFTFTAVCNTAFSESYSCNSSDGYAASQLVSRTCVYSGIKIVNGFEIYRDCWDWREIYEVEKIRFEEDSMCDQLRSEGCGFVNSNCLITSSKGHCLDEEITFSCPRVAAERQTELCGDILNCPDGNCTEEYKTQKDATEDFKEAATALAVADEIAKQFDFDNLSVFKGDGKKCEKDSLSFSNCCKDSGWGSDLGLASCTTEEQELGVKREQGAAHYVGTYCSGSNIFGCYKDTYTYCTYPSKLARIIVEQGSSQMGRDYGTARDPDCPGFTIDELNSLDFNAMDLTEFYEDVTEKAAAGTVGDPNQLIQDIADRLNQMGEGQ